MANRDIVVIGASAGGITALTEVVKNLPRQLNASVFIVQHTSPYSPSFLPQILSRSGPLEVVHPKDGEAIEQGKIYIAPPDYHILLEYGRILVRKGPKENRFRPSIDALFRSAAYTYKSRVIGVVLSGMLDDGTSGMWSVKRLGGIGIIQEPGDAICSSMPANVLEYVAVDYSVPVARIGSLIGQLTSEPAPEQELSDIPEIKKLEAEISVASEKSALETGIQSLGTPSSLTCPECNGTLVQLVEGNLIRYRCHTGHAFTQKALLENASKTIEEKLWQAVRTLEEVIFILENTANRYQESNQPDKAQKCLLKAKDARKRSSVLREFIFELEAF